MKSKTLFWIIIVAGIIIAIVLFSRGTNKQSSIEIPDGPVSYKEIAVDFPGQDMVETVVINNEKEWEEKFGSKSSGIDFNQNKILYINMGKRMTGGFTIKVLSIESKEGKIKANIEFVSPGKNCINMQVVTYPNLMIAIPCSNQEVIFDISNRSEDCPQ